MQNMTELASP